MKIQFLRALTCSAVASLLVTVQPARADAVVAWNSSGGFSPSQVQISPGETVTWHNSDPVLEVQVSLDLGFSFTLATNSSFGINFSSPVSFGFHSNYGDTGFVTVANSPPPQITLVAPRLVGSQFLFDATGLTTGKTNVLRASSNLTDWTPIRTNIATGTSITFTNPPSFSSRLFQVLELP